ncbi:5232_t:CDS:2 [Ambispora gerdemannii]|uniref:5232_t:CDS:1 n=1 Tax=Ambispora gerdemannii TaxID=144530 RepID=A0A9N8WN35_9GLOM|nr:5232_t:CDS:2 [Ambispora gerdemannii]
MSNSPTTGRVLCFLGFLIFIHASYSTYEHLSYLKAVEKVERDLPIDITIETLVSVAVFSLGIILVANPLKEILMKTEMAKQTIDKIDTRPSFMTFNHRGRIVQ